MQQSLEAMETAVRVLTALAKHEEPDATDVTYLRGMAPLLENADLDVLACDVVQQALKRREAARNPRTVESR